jgi:hypothetical protein
MRGNKSPRTSNTEIKKLENEGKEAEGQLFSFSDMTLLSSLEENIRLLPKITTTHKLGVAL